MLSVVLPSTVGVAKTMRSGGKTSGTPPTRVLTTCSLEKNKATININIRSYHVNLQLLLFVVCLLLLFLRGGRVDK